MNVEVDKWKLVPIESVVHLQFKIQMKMIEMGQEQPDLQLWISELDRKVCC